MSGTGDEGHEMRGLPFDRTTADAFLDGRVAPDDAPPELRDLSTLIRTARPPALTGGNALEGQVVAAFAAAVHGTPPGIPRGVHGKAKPMLSKLLTLKVAAAAATVALGGTAAAAATGSLPSPVQSAISQGLSHVGISIPSPNAHRSPHAAQGSATSGTHALQGALPPSAVFGQCTAYAAATRHTSTGTSSGHAQDSFPRLVAAATAAHETVSKYCADVTPPSTTPSTGPPSSVTTGKPSGAPGGGPPSSTPGGGPPSSTPGGGKPSGTPSGGKPSGTPSGGKPSGIPSGHA